MSWAPADSGVKGFEEERHFVFVCVCVVLMRILSEMGF